MKHLSDLNVAGKRVLVRADVNVPLGSDEAVDPHEDWRIRALAPTIEYLRKQEARIVLLGHLGRPEGKRDDKLSLRPVAAYLQRLLGERVEFIDPWLSPTGETGSVNSMNPMRPIALIENLRFHPGEEANDPEFVRSLVAYGDCYVNDAFGDSHRRHASIVGLPAVLPAAAGLLMEREIEVLTSVRENPARPLVMIIGGAKPETKLPLLNEHLGMSDHMLVGGVLANMLLALKGMAAGEIALAPERLEELKVTSEACDLTDTRLHVPVDAIISSARDGSEPGRVAAIAARESGVPGEDYAILDIGPDTIELFRRVIGLAKTIIWNGPMGLYEVEAFGRGTDAIAKSVVESSAYRVVGGGDTVAALRKLGLLEGIDHVSTGGGAMLQFLARGVLPGIEALK